MEQLELLQLLEPLELSVEPPLELPMALILMELHQEPLELSVELPMALLLMEIHQEPLEPLLEHTELVQETTQLLELLVVSLMEDHQESNIQALQELDHQALAVPITAQ